MFFLFIAPPSHPFSYAEGRTGEDRRVIFRTTVDMSPFPDDEGFIFDPANTAPEHPDLVWRPVTSLAGQLDWPLAANDPVAQPDLVGPVASLSAYPHSLPLLWSVLHEVALGLLPLLASSPVLFGAVGACVLAGKYARVKADAATHEKILALEHAVVALTNRVSTLEREVLQRAA